MLAVVDRPAAAHFVKAATLLMYDDVVAFQNKHTQTNKKKAAFKPRLDYFSSPRNENPSESTPPPPVCSLTGRWVTCVTGSHAAFENWTKLFLISSCNEFSPFWYSD